MFIIGQEKLKKTRQSLGEKNLEIYIINVNDQDSIPEYIKNSYKDE